MEPPGEVTASASPPARLRRLIGDSWVRFGIVTVVAAAAVSAVPVIAGTRWAHPAVVYSGPPPALLVGGISGAVALAVLSAVAWVASGRPGLAARSSFLLAAGISLLLIRVLGIDIAAVWAQSYQYPKGAVSGTYAQRAFDAFRGGSGFFGQAWGGHGNNTQFMMVAGALLLGVLLMVVCPWMEREGAPLSRRVTTHERFRVTPRAVLLVAAFTTAVAFDSWAAAAAGVTAFQSLTWVALAFIVAAVVSEARTPRHEGSHYLAALAGTGAVLAAAALWLPLVYLLGASWPVRINEYSPVVSRGK